MFRHFVVTLFKI